MAEYIRYYCQECGHGMEVRADGYPYSLDEFGDKQYGPPGLDWTFPGYVGNDDPHFCFGCGHRFMVDSRSPTDRCPHCPVSDIVSLSSLVGKRCPFCRAGTFARVPVFR